MLKIAIYGSRRQEPYIEEIARFLSRLNDAGAEIVMHRKLYNTLMHLKPMSLAPVRRVVDGSDFTADVAISIGGDGTMLRTAMWVGDKQIPILGVNTGHLGYLSTAAITELDAVADEILRGDYRTEDRALLHLIEPQVNTWAFALNEVAVAKDETSSMIVADTTVNDRPLAQYRADGLIVATPTGSTAYNLSVGGPVIQPTAPVWVLSPIAAHSLSMRPLVVADDSEIRITVSSRAASFRISLDGRSTTIPQGTEVRLRRAPFVMRLIVRPGHEFPAALREKLYWGINNI